MGIEIGAIIAAITTLGGVLGPTGAAVWTAALIGAISSGISYTISALTAPKPPGPLSNTIDKLRNIQRDPQAPGRVVYGHAFVSGYLVYAAVTNDEGKPGEGARYLHVCLVVAVGPISSITKIRLNDEKELTAYGDLVSFIPFIGSPDQRMFRGPVGIRRQDVKLPEEWLKKYRPLSGVAYLWATLAAHPTVFPAGPPSIRMEVEGALLYDRRSLAQDPNDIYTWQYSRNWAVCVYDYLTNKRYGRGATHDQVCYDCFVEAANVSDELVPAPSDAYDDPETGMQVIPTIRRYEVDGVFETNEQPVDIMSGLAAAAAGTITFYDGKWHIRAGKPRATLLDLVTDAPVVLTPDNLRDGEPLLINVRPGRKESVNIVRGSYIDPKHEFTAQDFPQQTHPDFVKEDGGIELISNLDMPWIQHVDRAQRLARISLYMSRLGMRLTFPGGPELLQIPPWEVIELHFPEYGWTNIAAEGDPPQYKQFYVADRHFHENGGINLILAEYSDVMYSDVIDPAILPDRSTLPDPFVVYPPTSVTATELLHRLPDGTRVAKLRITWQPPEDGFADYYEIVWRSTDGLSPYTARTVPGTVNMTEIIGLAAGTYQIRIQTRVLSRLSTEVIVYGAVTYVTLPPPAPTNFVVSLQGNGIRRFSWDVDGGTEPPDFRAYEIRYVEGFSVPAWDDARLFQGGITQRSFETRRPTKEGNYTFLIRSVDKTGLYSDDSKIGMVQIIISPREATELANREYSEEEWIGTLVDCRINAANELAGTAPRSTWGTAATFAGMATWAEGAPPARIIYTPPPINLSRADYATYEIKVEGRNIGGYTVLSRTRELTEDSFSQFTFVRSGFGNEFQFRLIAWGADNNRPLIIEKFYVTLRAREETDQLLAINSAAVRPVRRIEGANALANTGWISHVNASDAGISLDTATWLRFAGTGYATLPATSLPALFGDGTVEATMHITSLTHAGRIIGRGNDWSIDYTYESFEGRVQGVIRLNATDYAGTFDPIALGIGDALSVEEIAIVKDNGMVSLYVNRVLVGTTGPVLFHLSTDPVVVGARSLAGSFTLHARVDCKGVRVWDRALSADEIGGYSGLPVDVASPALAAYWRLDDPMPASPSPVRDSGPAALTGGQAVNATPVRIGVRMSPTIDLNILPSWGAASGQWVADVPAGTSVKVYMGVGEGDALPRAWELVGPAATQVHGFEYDEDPVGWKFWCLQVLEATDVTKTPLLTHLETTLAYVHRVGDLVVQPRQPFSVIRQVSLAVRTVTGSPIGWNLIAVDPLAARFALYDPAGPTSAKNAVVDVLFQGSRVWTS